MQVAGRVIPSVYLAAVIVLVTAVAGLLFAYQASSVKAVQFNTVFWGPGPYSMERWVSSQPGVHLNTKVPSSTVWVFVANDNGDWTQFWQDNLGSYDPEQPSVNFSSTTLLAVIGYSPRSGYQTNVTRIEDANSHLVVDVLFSEPSCATPAVAGWWLHVVGIPKTQLPFTFTGGQVRTWDCL